MSLRNDLPEIKALNVLEGLEFDIPEDTEARFNGAIQAADADQKNTIQIYGSIGFDFLTDTDNTEKRISAALRNIGDNPVTVNINSPGGNFFNGLAIYNLLRLHPNKVTVNVVALAGSASSMICMAGDQINMAPGSFLMVHRASAGVLGNWHDMSSAADRISEIDNAMSEIYAARSGVDENTSFGWIDRDRGQGSMFGAKSAVDIGLADAILADGEVSVTANYEQTSVPPERAVERLLQSKGLSRTDAKTLVTEIKSSLRDASDESVRDAAQKAVRDAGIMAALEELSNTLTG